MLTFKNYIDQQSINADKKSQEVLELYLDYVEWLIAQLKDKPDAKQEYTTTELLVQLKLIGAYCQAEQQKSLNTPLLLETDQPWHESHVADVKANIPSVLKSYDTRVWNGVRNHLDAGNTAKAVPYKYANRVSLLVLLGTAVTSLLPKALLALPIPGFGLRLLLTGLTVMSAMAAVYTNKKKQFHEGNRVFAADDFQFGHTAHQRTMMLQPYRNGFTQEPVNEVQPRLRDTSVDLFDKKREAVNIATAGIQADLQKQDNVAEACTLSSMVTKRYSSLYSNYDSYKALETKQFAQLDMGADQPADLEAVAENLREKVREKTSVSL